MAKRIVNSLKSFLNKHQCKKIIVAYSGGVDSQVLLHALASLKNEYHFELRAIHIHHGLQADADNWVLHCKKTCQELGIAFFLEYIAISKIKGSGIEAAAREKRYQAIAAHLAQGEYLITGQHQNDQAETLLFNLLRGTGISGMQGMQTCQPFSQGYLARPLLAITREAILSYANVNKLAWIEDESNKNTHFARNYLRAEVFPVLTKRWPQAVGQFAKACDWAQEAQLLLNELAENDYSLAKTKNENALSLASLKNLSLLRQKNLLRYWLKKLELLPPSQVQLAGILEQMFEAKEDKNPIIRWENAEIRRYQGEIYAFKPLNPFDNSQIIFWEDVKKPLGIKGGGIVEYPFEIVPEAKITVRFRQGGEKIRVGKKLRKMLKQIMQEKGIPPWLRERVPLLYFDEECVSILEEKKQCHLK